ncbi:hypothetical protein GGI13_005493 [Coemansia sp. RSA 455]|nr:hypothetical protein GGI13_005493 [Coemansia sp. RSA 455]
MKAIKYVTLGFQLIQSIGYVRAAIDAPREESIESIALQVPEAPPPAAAVNGNLESICPEILVQRMAQLAEVESDMLQEAELPGQLTGEFSHLVDEAAASLGQSREQVYRGVDALIRARTRRNPDRPRLTLGSVVDTIYNDETKKFIVRMFDLFRKVMSAYVKSAAADAAAAASSSSASAEAASAATAASTNVFSKLFGISESGPSSSSQSPSSSAAAPEKSSEAPPPETSTTSSPTSSLSSSSTSASTTPTSTFSPTTASTTSTSSSQVQTSTSTTSTTTSKSSKSHSKESSTSSEGDDDDTDEDDDEDDEDDSSSSSGGQSKSATKKGP